MRKSRGRREYFFILSSPSGLLDRPRRQGGAVAVAHGEKPLLLHPEDVLGVDANLVAPEAQFALDDAVAGARLARQAHLVLDLGLQADAEGVGAERVDLCGGGEDGGGGGAVHARIVTDGKQNCKSLGKIYFLSAIPYRPGGRWLLSGGVQ